MSDSGSSKSHQTISAQIYGSQLIGRYTFQICCSAQLIYLKITLAKFYRIFRKISLSAVCLICFGRIVMFAITIILIPSGKTNSFIQFSRFSTFLMHKIIKKNWRLSYINHISSYNYCKLNHVQSSIFFKNAIQKTFFSTYSYFFIYV